MPESSHDDDRRSPDLLHELREVRELLRAVWSKISRIEDEFVACRQARSDNE